MQISPTTDQRGFTLLELMVALTVGMIVLGAAYRSFSVTVDARQRIARVSSDTQAWRFFAERLRIDLSNVVAGESSFRGAADSITLHAELPGTGRLEIRYDQRKTATGGQIRRRVIGIDGEQESESLVFEGASRLAFRYLNQAGWRTESTADDALPRAVECTVTGEKRERQFIIAIEAEHVQA